MDVVNNRLDQYIARRFPKKFPKSVVCPEGDVKAIYHYTTVDVFEKMLHADADFYLSESLLLNDDKEFFTGLELLFRYQKETRQDILCGLTQEHVKDWVGNPAEEPWIMCFSSESDSLGQWISYADRQKGGVAIGFDMDKLFARLTDAYASWKEDDCKYGCLMYLVPCFYTEIDKPCILDLIDFLFGEYREQMYSWYDAQDVQSRCSITMELMLIFSSMIKHDSFREEKEWRIVFLPHSEMRIAQYQFLGGKPRLKSRMFNTENVLRDVIVDVVISPHGSGTKPVESLVKLCGLNHEMCRNSKSPYNGL